MQSFNIVNTPVILLFSKKWAPGLSAEDNTIANWEMMLKARFKSQRGQTAEHMVQN